MIIGGPSLFEFGWLLCGYIPRLRAKVLAENSKCIVVCRPGEDYLFSDFAHEFRHIEGDYGCDRWYCHGGLANLPDDLAARLDDETRWFKPCRATCTSGPTQYFQYGSNRCDGFDVVIHARAVRKYHTDYRNWPVDNYRELLRALGRPRACSIGTIDGAHHIPGTKDRRGIVLKHLCGIMRNSRVVIGPSSGPMHLASLCGTPHVVWTFNQRLRSIGWRTNRQRYESLWNPLGTRVVVIDNEGWQPRVKTVVQAVKGIL